MNAPLTTGSASNLNVGRLSRSTTMHSVTYCTTCKEDVDSSMEHDHMLAPHGDNPGEIRKPYITQKDTGRYILPDDRRHTAQEQVQDEGSEDDDPMSWTCTICHITINIFTREDHCSTKPHVAKMRRAAEAAGIAELSPPVIPTWLCTVCEETMNIFYQAEHLAGKQHFRMLREKGLDEDPDYSAGLTMDTSNYTQTVDGRATDDELPINHLASTGTAQTAPNRAQAAESSSTDPGNTFYCAICPGEFPLPEYAQHLSTSSTCTICGKSLHANWLYAHRLSHEDPDSSQHANLENRHDDGNKQTGSAADATENATTDTPKATVVPLSFTAWLEMVKRDPPPPLEPDEDPAPLEPGQDTSPLELHQDPAPLEPDQDPTPLELDQDFTPLQPDQDPSPLEPDQDPAPLGPEHQDSAQPPDHAADNTPQTPLCSFCRHRAYPFATKKPKNFKKGCVCGKSTDQAPPGPKRREKKQVASKPQRVVQVDSSAPATPDDTLHGQNSSQVTNAEVFYCTPCEKDVKLESKSVHMSSNKHRRHERRLKATKNTAPVERPKGTFYCDVCVGTYKLEGKSGHLEGKKHQRRAAAQSAEQKIAEEAQQALASSEIADQDRNSAATGRVETFYCTVCEKDVLLEDQSVHVNSKRHRCHRPKPEGKQDEPQLATTGEGGAPQQQAAPASRIAATPKDVSPAKPGWSGMDLAEMWECTACNVKMPRSRKSAHEWLPRHIRNKEAMS